MNSVRDIFRELSRFKMGQRRSVKINTELDVEFIRKVKIVYIVSCGYENPLCI